MHYSVHRFGIHVHHFIQIAGNGAFQFRSGVVQSAQSGLQGDGIAAVLAGRIFIHHFLLLFESPEVVLNEEGGVEFTHRHLVVDYVTKEQKNAKAKIDNEIQTTDENE